MDPPTKLLSFDSYIRDLESHPRHYEKHSQYDVDNIEHAIDTLTVLVEEMRGNPPDDAEEF